MNNPHEATTIFYIEPDGTDPHPESPMWVSGNFTSVRNYAEKHLMLITKTAKICPGSGFGITIGSGVREHVGNYKDEMEVDLISNPNAVQTSGSGSSTQTEEFPTPKITLYRRGCTLCDRDGNTYITETGRPLAMFTDTIDLDNYENPEIEILPYVKDPSNG